MDPRRLLIGLNAAATLSRAALCRLSTTLDAWALRGLPPRPAHRAAALGVPESQLRKALELRRQAASLADREIEAAQRAGCTILTLLDDGYPSTLRDLSLPPPVLYLRGSLPPGPAVAIVGSRKMDGYGEQAAGCFARRLASAGVTVVSGFALGVDAAAHRGALAAAGGRTVAVLGCGLDVTYPRQHRDLARAVPERGALISELPLGTLPRPWHFPVRNRLIAALAVGTLVVQATPRSGSLITAHHALELGREVYAVPGRIFDELSLGTNELLADGALVARTPDDVLESLPLTERRRLTPPPPVTEQPLPPRPGGLSGALLEHLPRATPRTVEELAAAVGGTVDAVLAALLELELAGWIRRQPGPVYVR